MASRGWEQLTTDGAPAPTAPFSQGADAGEYVFVSGQLGLDPETGQRPDGVKEETAQLLANIEAVLAAAGLGMENVVRTTVYMKDFADYAKMNEAYGEAFSEPWPARATVAVADLLAGCRVEIEAVAKRN